MKDTNNDFENVQTNGNLEDKACSCGANCNCKNSNKTLLLVFVILMFVCLIGGFIGGYLLKSNDKSSDDLSNNEVKVEDNINDNKDDIVEEYDYNDSFAKVEKKLIKLTSLNGLYEYFANGTLTANGNFYYVFEYGSVNDLDVKIKFIQNEDEFNVNQRVTLVIDNKDYVLHESSSTIAHAFYEFSEFRIHEYKDGVLFMEYQSSTYGKSDQVKPNISMYAYNKNGQMFKFDDVIVDYFAVSPDNEGFVDSEVECPIVVEDDKISYCREVNEHRDSRDYVAFDIEFCEFDGVNEKVIKTIRDVYSSEQY